IDDDPELDPIRDDPGFAEVRELGRLDRRYASVWTDDARFEAVPLWGLNPTEHLRRCRDLASQGYHPVSVSVARTLPGGTVVTASVWHRPVMSEQAKDQLAVQQARAAAALVRLGYAEQVWPVMRLSPDPRLRSFLINWLRPLGAKPQVVAAELA